jgi:hypothetical protein
MPADAQALIDRVVARVTSTGGTTAITLTDVQAARALGVIAGASDEEAVQQMITRQLLLNEVSRFPPSEPAPAAIDAQEARLRAAAGARLPEVLRTTGLSDERIRDIARDTLRIEAYIDQRFGTALQATDDEAQQYYDAHPAEFRRDGAVIPFAEALPTARERASAERRRAQVDRWLLDLRLRADIARPAAPPP